MRAFLLTALFLRAQIIIPPPPPPPPLQLSGTPVNVQAIDQTGSLAIHGLVARPDTGEPIGDVLVTLLVPLPAGAATLGTAIGQLSATTDSSGKFAFRDLPPRQYTIRAQREGYFGPTFSGSVAIPATVNQTVILNSSQQITNVTIHLTPGGTLTGYVRDLNNQPASNIPVAALRLGYRDGRRWLQLTRTITSDNRGQFRLLGLPPGDYYLRSEIRPGSFLGSSPQLRYITTYFPGVSHPDGALTIPVAADTEVYADLNVLTGTPVRISGTVVNTIPDVAGDPIGFLLMPQDATKIDAGNGGNLIPNSAADRSNGHFEIVTMQPGVYYIMPVVPVRSAQGTPVSPVNGGPPRYHTARALVEVRDRDIDGIVLNVTRGIDLDVHVSGLGTGTTSQTNLRFALRPLDATSTPLTTQATLAQQLNVAGNLKFVGLPEGRYALVPQLLPPNLYVSEVRQGARNAYDDGVITIGRDSADPVEIVLASGGGNIEGSLESGELARPGMVARVSLVPQNSRRGNPMFYKRAAVINGRFNINGIAPGEYKVFAWEDLPANADENAEFVGLYEQFGRAVSIGAAPASVIVPLIRLKP